MVNELLVYHHLGLGDHIVCNAMIRSFCGKYDVVYLFCKAHNIPSIKAMFADIRNLSIELVQDDIMAVRFFNEFQFDKIGIGYYGDSWDEHSGESFDVQFYRQAGMSIDKRWSGFAVMRNINTECRLMEKLRLPREYIFLHDDEDRGYKIDRRKINTLLPIIKPVKGFTENAIDYLAIIENAAEIHCINSSFMLLVDSFPMKCPLYWHKYARDEGKISTPVVLNKWKVLL